MKTNLRLASSPAEEVRASRSSPIRVVLAEGHAMMRRSLRAIIESEPDVELIAETTSLHSMIHQARNRKPDVLVLDLGFHGGLCSQTIERLREHAPAVQIVVLGLEDSPAFALHAIAMGAHGYVSKTQADSELPAAIRAAGQASHAYSPL